MSTTDNGLQKRRSFLSKLAAGAAIVSGAVFKSQPAAAQATSQSSWRPARHTQDDWLDQIPWLSGGAVAYRAFRRIQAGEGRAQALKEAGRDTIKVTVGKGVGAVASTATNSEPTIFLLAAASTALTTAVLDVRRSWGAATEPLRHVANQAEELLEHYDPDYARPAMTWRRRIGDATKRIVPLARTK